MHVIGRFWYLGLGPKIPSVWVFTRWVLAEQLTVTRIYKKEVGQTILCPGAGNNLCYRLCRWDNVTVIPAFNLLLNSHWIQRRLHLKKLKTDWSLNICNATSKILSLRERLPWHRRGRQTCCNTTMDANLDVQSITRNRKVPRKLLLPSVSPSESPFGQAQVYLSLDTSCRVHAHKVISNTSHLLITSIQQNRQNGPGETCRPQCQ